MERVTGVQIPAKVPGKQIVPSSLTEEWELRIIALLDDGTPGYRLNTVAVAPNGSIRKKELYVGIKAYHKAPQCNATVESIWENSSPNLKFHEEAILVDAGDLQYFVCPICGATVDVKELLKQYWQNSKRIPIFVGAPDE